jgi:hypothetical protein
MISNYSIKKDGFEVFDINKSKFYTNKQKLFNEILKKLPNDYHFLDYEYKIINSTIYTFHRDVTSSQNYQKLLYPSYTVIFYFTDNTNDKLISICPNSNKQKFYISDPITICGRKCGGRAILFNADMVHAGAINETSERTAFQYKICHKDDINKLKHLNGQYIEKKSEIRTFTLLDKIIASFSHKTISIFDTELGNITVRKTNNKFINTISKLINLDFYINSSRQCGGVLKKF